MAPEGFVAPGDCIPCMDKNQVCFLPLFEFRIGIQYLNF